MISDKKTSYFLTKKQLSGRLKTYLGVFILLEPAMPIDKEWDL